MSISTRNPIKIEKILNLLSHDPSIKELFPTKKRERFLQHAVLTTVIALKSHNTEKMTKLLMKTDYDNIFRHGRG